MTEPLKCNQCGGTSFTMLASKIQGLDKVIDLYLCRECKTGKTVITTKQDTPPTAEPEVTVDDGDVEEYEEILEEPENPYEEEYDGWDPNIG